MTDTRFMHWTPEMFRLINDQFECQPLEDLLRWAAASFAPNLALATGFGPEGIVLMHLMSQIAPETTVFYLDTDLLFPETYDLRDELEARLGVKLVRVHSGLALGAQAATHGPNLWARNPDQCCFIRKVKPLREFLSSRQAWITGIRRDQTAARAKAGLVEWDRANKLIKLNPLANWTERQVWARIGQHGLPYNRLHSAGYPSLGCWPCTRPAAEGADPRSGRWAGLSKTECGIHLQGEPLAAETAGPSIRPQ